MRTLAFAAIGSLFLTGCVSTQSKKPVELTAFDRKAAAYVLETGAAQISGEAFLRTIGGDVKTCAGEQVWLIPVTKHAAQRITALYGNIDRGIADATFIARALPTFSNEDPAYQQYRRTTNCESTGRFAFDNVAAGEYFLITSVMWGDGTSPRLNQGGNIMLRAKVAEAQHLSVQMTGR